MELESMSKKIIGLETRVIPEATVSAKRLATIYIANINLNKNSERKRNRSILHNPVRKISTVISANLSNQSAEETTDIQLEMVEDFFEKLIRKRGDLIGHELSEFDQQWNIDADGNFKEIQQVNWFFMSYKSQVHTIIAKEVQKVDH